jgi:GNAT superfamily N-acetyltransferase
VRSASRWTPAQVWRRSREVLQREGMRSLALRMIGELVYRRMILMQRPFDFSMREVELEAATSFRPLQVEDLDLYLALRPEADEEEIRRRFAFRHVCYGAFREDRLVQACWIATERAYIDYLGAEIRLLSGVGYLYDLYAIPEARGLNLHRAMWPHVFRYFRNAGPIYVLAAFHPENGIQRIFARLGFRPVGTLGYVGVGPARRLFYRGEPVLAGPPRRAHRF